MIPFFSWPLSLSARGSGLSQALGNLELAQHQRVLQRAVEVLEGLHVVVLADLVAQVAQPALLGVVVGLDLIRQFYQLVQGLAVCLQDEAEPDKQVGTRDLGFELPDEEMSNFPVEKSASQQHLGQLVVQVGFILKHEHS